MPGTDSGWKSIDSLPSPFNIDYSDLRYRDIQLQLR